MGVLSRAACGALLVVGALLSTTSTTRSAHAQQESAAAAMAGHDDDAPKKTTQKPEEQLVVKGGEQAPSPHWTQSRSFAATRFWLLDPGNQSVEVWYSTRIRHDGNAGDTRHLWQLEYMFSPFRGFEVDVYANYAHDQLDGFHIEGAQIEGRIAPFRYGQVFLNPVLYLEWHPQNRDANRAEARLLLGGQLFTPRLHAALNPFWEQNLDSADGVRAHYVADREIGLSAALQYAIIDRHFALGAEARVLADQQGAPTSYQSVVKAGPALWLNFDDGHVFLTATALVGLTNKSDLLNPIVILGIHP